MLPLLSASPRNLCENSVQYSVFSIQLPDLRVFVASFVAIFVGSCCWANVYVDKARDKARDKDGGLFLMLCSIWRLCARGPTGHCSLPFRPEQKSGVRSQGSGKNSNLTPDTETCLPETSSHLLPTLSRLPLVH